MAPVGPGLEMVSFLLRGLSAGAPEVALAGLGPDLVMLPFRSIRNGYLT